MQGSGSRPMPCRVVLTIIQNQLSQKALTTQVISKYCTAMLWVGIWSWPKCLIPRLSRSALGRHGYHSRKDSVIEDTAASSQAFALIGSESMEIRMNRSTRKLKLHPYSTYRYVDSYVRSGGFAVYGKNSERSSRVLFGLCCFLEHRSLDLRTVRNRW